VRFPWPRSLAGQMALLVAMALFVAQAINLGLLLRERTAFRLASAVNPAATRIVDGVEREISTGRTLRADRGRVRRMTTNPVAANLPRSPEVEAGLRDALNDAGFKPGQIVTGLHSLGDRSDLPRSFRRRFTPRPGALELLIAVEQPGKGWLVVATPWPRNGVPIVGRLLFQTLLIYAIILLPVLWITRRISRPLRSLTVAATGFDPRAETAPVEAEGPHDVRVLIDAFNALRLRVVAMLDEKDRMLGAIGHDLRTPLAALRVRIESVEDEDDRTRMAGTIDEMNRTLDDILSLARLGRSSEAVTQVDLSALVEAVVEDFRDLDADVAFTETPRVLMRLRPTLVRRAVRNLIENAIKYAGSAEVAILSEANRVVICVTDRGPGIPVDRLEDVFDPFTRLETSRNRETGGIGLGLALARAIVREAGGDITLANRTEGGLEARIELPRAQ
jgi:signal transduction histidine kinase